MTSRSKLNDAKPARVSSPPPGHRIALSRASTDEFDGYDPLPSIAWPPETKGASACFRDVFCRRFQVAPERYEVDMLRRCLPRRVRLLAPLIRLFSPDLFSVDRLFIDSIGRTRNAAELKTELRAFRDHAANRRWKRRVLKLRLSVWRILDTADAVLPHLKSSAVSRPIDSNVPWN
jgi:hypothetical protein